MKHKILQFKKDNLEARNEVINEVDTEYENLINKPIIFEESYNKVLVNVSRDDIFKVFVALESLIESENHILEEINTSGMEEVSTEMSNFIFDIYRNLKKQFLKSDQSFVSVYLDFWELDTIIRDIEIKIVLSKITQGLVKLQKHPLSEEKKNAMRTFKDLLLVQYKELENKIFPQGSPLGTDKIISN